MKEQCVCVCVCVFVCVFVVYVCQTKRMTQKKECMCFYAEGSELEKEVQCFGQKKSMSVCAYVCVCVCLRGREEKKVEERAKKRRKEMIDRQRQKQKTEILKGKCKKRDKNSQKIIEDVKNDA